MAAGSAAEPVPAPVERQQRLAHLVHQLVVQRVHLLRPIQPHDAGAALAVVAHLGEDRRVVHRVVSSHCGHYTFAHTITLVAAEPGIKTYLDLPLLAGRAAPQFGHGRAK